MYYWSNIYWRFKSWNVSLFKDEIQHFYVKSASSWAICFSKRQIHLVTSVLQGTMNMWACVSVCSAFSKGFTSPLKIFSLIYCFAHHGSTDRKKNNINAHQGETNSNVTWMWKARSAKALLTVTPPQGKYWSWAAIMFTTFILFVTAINKPIC